MSKEIFTFIAASNIKQQKQQQQNDNHTFHMHMNIYVYINLYFCYFIGIIFTDVCDKKEKIMSIGSGKGTTS